MESAHDLIPERYEIYTGLSFPVTHVHCIAFFQDMETVVSLHLPVFSLRLSQVACELHEVRAMSALCSTVSPVPTWPGI